MVAQVAFNHLNSHTKKEVKALLCADDKKCDLDYEFLAAANWPDMIKTPEGGTINIFSPWHFVPMEYNPDAPSTTPVVPVDNNIISALNQSIATVPNTQAELALRQMFLKFLIHFVGDIHQPLHTTQMLSPAFPKTDFGGNAYWVQYINPGESTPDPLVKNLHSVWDNAFSLRLQDTGIPLTIPYDLDRDQSDVQKTARRLEEKFKKNPDYVQLETELKNNTTPTQWALESYPLGIEARTRVGPLPTPDELTLWQKDQTKAPLISKDYIAWGTKIADERLVMAGYRLADTLNTMFSEEPKDALVN